MKVAIFDLDGCISDDRHRRKLSDESSFTAYHSLATKDKAAHVALARRWAEVADKVVFLTGRPERFRQDTMEWIDRELALPHRYGLYMRPEDNHQSQVNVKGELFAQMMAELKSPDVMAAFDDREDIIAKYRSIGIVAHILRVEDNELDDVFLYPLEVMLTTVPGVLSAAAATFQERNAKYKDAWKQVGPVLKALFPEGVSLKTSDDHTRYHLLMLMVVKMTRFANSRMEHADSMRDAAVYAAMIETLISNKEQQ